MNAQLIALLIFKVIQAVNDPHVKSMRQAAKDVIAAMNKELPAKPDGTPWTEQDILDQAELAKQPFLDVLALLRGKNS